MFIFNINISINKGIFAITNVWTNVWPTIYWTQSLFILFSAQSFSAQFCFRPTLFGPVFIISITCMYYMNTGLFTILFYYTISKKQSDACTCNNLRKITMYPHTTYFRSQPNFGHSRKYITFQHFNRPRIKFK